MWALAKLLARTIPGILFERWQRLLLEEMREFDWLLASQLDASFPETMNRLSGDIGPQRPISKRETQIRNLVDLTMTLNGRSPLGYCLRRSLIRFYYLRREGLPLEAHFGVRFIDGEPDRPITGHAWLTLDGKPYHELDENWIGFTVMVSYPSDL